MARTDTLGHFLTDVADAIREKKGTTETIQASEFDTEIENLPGGEDISKYITINITKNYPSAQSLLIKLPAITIASNVTNINGLFQNCSNLETIEKIISTNSVTSMSSMFMSCSKLTSVDFSEFDTSNATSMYYMFMYCSNLKELDLSSFVTTKVTSMNGMFQYTGKLKKIDMRNFTFDAVTNYDDMFGTHGQGVLDDCLIIVKGDTEKEWITSKFSRLTNVKTVAEYEAE